MDKITCFISHTWSDGQHGFAKYFVSRLSRFRRMKAWLDEEQIKSSQNLQQRIEVGLRGESDCCIALLSPEFMAARNAPNELEVAARLSYETGKPLFPVLLRRFEIPLSVAGLRWFDLSMAVEPNTLEVNNRVFTPTMKELVSDIRAVLDPTPDVMAFFTPPTRSRVVLVTNLGYEGPHPYPGGVSTTVQFRDAVAISLNTLVRRASIASRQEIHSNRVSGDLLRGLLNGDDSVISYGSSKINKCTEMMLEHLSARAGQAIRFVLEEDLRSGKRESNFPTDEKAKRAALIWRGTQLFHDDNTDYAIVMRLIEKSKIWWLFAGCGRPGSVAARKLVFEPDWSRFLWDDLGTRWKRSSFVARVTVQHDRKNRPEFVAFQDLETLWL